MRTILSQFFQNTATRLKSLLPLIVIPLIAVLMASVVCAIILTFSGANPFVAYASLLHGSFGSMSSFLRTLDKATPLLFSGLAISFAFKAGLFNIGAQGQLIFGALAAGIAGFGIQGLPVYFHIPLALLAGAVAGGFYSMIQGLLKAYTGAHEVITGIMLNYVAINITDYLSSGPFIDKTPGNIIARTPVILKTAQFPQLNLIPFGFILAVLLAFIVWWVFNFTTCGFTIQTVGVNSHAARYAGINVRFVLVVTMLISGIFAGLGGAVETQSVIHRFQPGFNVGLGFEGITIALLGRTHPFGVVFASVLFGAMKAGANQMQFSAGVATELIDVIMALTLFFVAADTVIRRLIPMKDINPFKMTLTTGWNK